jgi:hypothetical protein
MTDKEAMKLALFALDIVKMHYTQSRHVNEAITALKERLAQPPQRTWVRLAEEEIHNLDPLPHQMFDIQRIKFARAIEAKLKEKNNG